MACKISTTTTYGVIQYTDALHHCRWKDTLHKFLENPLIQYYKPHAERKTFDNIYSDIYSRAKKVKGLGKLTVYNITTAICKAYAIPIKRVYIIGGGPKRAVKLLGLSTKSHSLRGVTLQYVEITDIQAAFKKHGYSLPIESTDGDSFETFICKWQKGI
jgi:hypothetical protein